MADITVTQTRSAIGTKPKHRGTLRALGLGKIGQTNTLPDRPEIRGMIARVPHLITVGDVDGPQGSDKANEAGEAVDEAVAEVVEEAAAEQADETVPFAGDDAVANADDEEEES